MNTIEKLCKGLKNLEKGVNQIMDAFIEVTEKLDGIKVMLPLKSIKSISKDKNGDTFIETGKDNDGNPTGIYCSESYSSLIIKLLKYII